LAVEGIAAERFSNLAIKMLAVKSLWLISQSCTASIFGEKLMIEAVAEA
jgi:hypothetical protein